MASLHDCKVFYSAARARARRKPWVLQTPAALSLTGKRKQDTFSSERIAMTEFLLQHLASIASHLPIHRAYLKCNHAHLIAYRDKAVEYRKKTMYTADISRKKRSILSAENVNLMLILLVFC